jgi:Family of unknown function (DUF6069)
MSDRRVDPSVASAPGGWAVDGRKLWMGGLLAGIVAAGVAVVALLVARGIFDIRVFVRGEQGGVVNESTWWYAIVSFGAAIGATALLHLLLLTAPSPFRFFGWIVGLAVTVAVIVPFTTSAEPANKIGTAAVNLAIGIAVLSIVSGVGRSAVYEKGSPR